MASETVAKPRIEVIDVDEVKRRIRDGEVDEALAEWMMKDLDRVFARIDAGIAETKKNMDDLEKSLKQR